MIRELKNASLAGRDKWPKNVTEAYNYLSKWESDGTALGVDPVTMKERPSPAKDVKDANHLIK
jgi:hypothetical protein